MFDEDFYVEKIANLQEELKSYGKEMVELLHGIYGANNVGGKKQNTNYDLKTSPFHMIEYLKTELVELLQTSQENEQVYLKYEKDLQKCNSLVGILSNVGKIVDSMNKFDASLSKFQIVQAAQLLVQIDGAVLDLPRQSKEANIPVGGQMYKLLKTEKSIMKSRFKSTLRRIFKESVQFGFGSARVNKKIVDYLKCEEKVLEEPLLLEDVYKAATISENIQNLLQELLQELWSNVFVPLWHEKTQYSPSKIVQNEISEFLLSSVASGVEARENETQGGRLGTSKLPLPDLFDHVGKFLEFLWIDVLLNNQEVCLIAAEILRSEPYCLLPALNEAINQKLPKNEADLPQFKRSLEDCCRILDAKLMSTVRLSGNVEITSPTLSETLDNLSLIFSNLRRKEILKTARDLVLSDYHNAMIGSGDAMEDDLASAGNIGDPKAILDQSGTLAMQKLKFDSCQVSLTACRLLKFVHDIMKQATNASPEVANILFHSARDCLEIFIATIPIKFEEIINTTPRMGAVFYNDCLYLAHNTILLTHKYRMETGEDSPRTADPTVNALQGNIGFIDFIPRLRKLGDACMRNHLLQQQSILREMVKRIGLAPERQSKKMKNKTIGTGLFADRLKNKFLSGSGLAEDTTNANDNDGIVTTTVKDLVEEECSNDENRASMLVDQLEKLSTQWIGVLQEVNYARFMGFLIDDMLKELMLPILQATCITETAASEIYRVYKIIQRVKSLLPNDNAEIEQQWKSACVSWDKFLALTDLLEFNLNDIADALSRKKFISFTGQELITLIKALFEESARRQSLIASITEISSL